MSDYYFVKTSAHLDDAFCFIEREPDGTNDYTYKMAEGEPMGSLYPKNAKVTMAKEYKGTKLPSLVGNVMSFLIVDEAMRQAIEKGKVGKVEYLPLSILDHKKKLASDKYFIVNPLGTFDCLDLKKSKIERVDDEIVGIQQFVLDPKKLAKAPDLFRLPEMPNQYVFSKDLLGALKKLNPTNVVVTKVEDCKDFV
jgi:hypothetical protein